MSAPQPGSSSSAGAVSVELEDCAGRLAATHDQVSRDPHLQLRWPPGEPTADTIKVHRPAERFRGDDERWVELMQMPAQPLLRSTALVDKVIVIVDQQPQNLVERKVRPGAVGRAEQHEVVASPLSRRT